MSIPLHAVFLFLLVDTVICPTSTGQLVLSYDWPCDSSSVSITLHLTFHPWQKDTVVSVLLCTQLLLCEPLQVDVLAMRGASERHLAVWARYTARSHHLWCEVEYAGNHYMLYFYTTR